MLKHQRIAIPISQMTLIFHVTIGRFCYKNQYLEAKMEGLEWHIWRVIRNGKNFGLILTVA